MMNKPMMGQAPAPSAPTGVNFQSDPNMRQQFKGFMSGMAARNMPAPQPQPAMMMPAMPQQMANMDIFQPVQNFRAGGGVGRSDYEGAPIEGVTGSVAGSTTSDAGSFGSFTDYGEDQRNDPGSIESILSAPRGSVANAYDSAIAGIRSILGMNEPQQTQSAPTASGDALQNLVDRNLEVRDAADRMRRVDAGNQVLQNIQSVIDSNAADEIASADTNLLDVDLFAMESPEQQAQRELAQAITARGGVVEVDPITGQVSERVSLPTSRPDLQVQGPFPQVDIAAPTPRPDVPQQIATPLPRPELPITRAEDIPSTMPRESTPMETVMDRAARKNVVPMDNDVRVMEGAGFGVGKTPLQQLYNRATRESVIEAPSGPVGSIIQGGLNALARGVSGSVLEKIAEGGQPVLDENNQIVGVVHQGGLFGGNVYTGRSEYSPIGRGGTGFRSLNQQGQISTGNTQQGQEVSEDDDFIRRFIGKLTRSAS